VLYIYNNNNNNNNNKIKKFLAELNSDMELRKTPGNSKGVSTS